MRQRRIVIAGAPHHVILRGNNRRRLFSYPRDYRLFLRLAAAASHEHCTDVHAYALMTNHVHLVATPRTAEELSKFVKYIAQRYAQRRNRARRATGKLFEQRFWSEPVADERALAEITVYVDLNPVRAGLVEAPEDYTWSTARYHLGVPIPGDLPRIWHPSRWYAQLGYTIGERAACYACCLHERDEATPPQTRTAAAEELSPDQYTLRLRRPDGTSAK
ncbi:MAG: transposase [Myxococcales bacterium]|nr:transposase [Myxococcales bacterium]